MQIFNKSVDLYTIGHRVRRVTLRILGVLVAVFSSTRAHAANAMQTVFNVACPGCVNYVEAICDTSEGYAVNDGKGSAEFYPCIPTYNTRIAAITDGDCVKKLQSWGMCVSSPSGGSQKLLYNSGLSCADGAAVALGYQVDYSGVTLESQKVVCGWVEFGPTNGIYICCPAVSTSEPIMTGCAIATATCIEANAYGWYSGEMEVLGVGSIGESADASCSQVFQNYFNGTLDAINTGWCDGTGIYEDGLGILLIANECFGTQQINTNMVFQSGMVVTSCAGYCGYYHNGASDYPLQTTSIGQYCEACPGEIEAPFYCGVELSSYSIRSSGTGIESCYAVPNTNPISGIRDGIGTFTLTYNGNCPYQSDDEAGEESGGSSDSESGDSAEDGEAGDADGSQEGSAEEEGTESGS